MYIHQDFIEHVCIHVHMTNGPIHQDMLEMEIDAGARD